ncbi:MAG TPA: rhodanese-like domain-containing protein [Pyrinomonadaceae bacterium]|jgi:rhodanese-related sulfurtransferase
MNRSRFTALAATAALSLAALTSCGGPSTPRVEASNILYIATQVPLTPVDIRSRAAYDEGHLAHAVFMEKGVVPPELEETPKEYPLVVCGKGADGEAEERAAAALVKAGFKNVSILKGGMNAYLAYKLPTQSTEDEQMGAEVMEKFRKSPEPGAAERLREKIKIDKPVF